MWSLLAGIVIAPFYAFINAQMFSSDETTNVVSEEAHVEEKAPAFDTGSSDGPPTQALDLSEIEKYASSRDEAVSA